MGHFAELYCKQHNLPPEHFEQDVLRKALPARIRLIAPLVTMFNPGFFAPDRDFIRDIGAMRQPSDFKWALADFRSDPANRRLARRQLRIRASISRMRRVIESVPAFLTDQSSRHEIAAETDPSAHD